MPNDLFETFFSSMEPIPFDPHGNDECLSPLGHHDVHCMLDAVHMLLGSDIIPDVDFSTSVSSFHEEVMPALFLKEEDLSNLSFMNSYQEKKKRTTNTEEVEPVKRCAKKARIHTDEYPLHQLTDISDTASVVSSSGATSTSSAGRFRECQEGQWYERYQELVNFHQERGHSMVPHNWHENPRLAQWVKRQRYQYRLKQQGKNSTITADREEALNRLGFVWDSHTTTWDQRFNELLAFKATHGHCRVPTNYQLNQSLAIWVKCQRRQHALFFSNSASTMTLERLSRLTEVGFDFNPRNLSRRAMI